MKTVKCLERGYVGLVDHTNDYLSYEIYAPFIIVDSLMERTRSFVTGDVSFYVPDYTEWRTVSKNGSERRASSGVGSCFSILLEDHVERSKELYNRAIQHGISRDQAKLFLPTYSLYVLYHWDASIGSLLYLLDHRFDDDEVEKQEYLEALKALTEPLYPDTFKEMFGDDDVVG